MSYTLKHLLELSAEDTENILLQPVFQDELLKVTLFSLASGQSLKQHSSSKPALLQIIHGKALLGLGDDTLEAKAGDWVHMPAHLPHSIQAITTLHFLLTILKQKDL
jgi:quercetin dioxygenase-like cupin family protein